MEEKLHQAAISGLMKLDNALKSSSYEKGLFHLMEQPFFI